MFMHESGMNEQVININGKNKFNNFKWNADYNGKVANISLDSNNNGKKKSLNFILDNNDLVNMLNVNTNDIIIDKRLTNDFKENNRSLNLNPMVIELEKNPNYVAQTSQMQSPPNLNGLDFYLPMIIKKKPTNLISLPKKKITVRNSRMSSKKSSRTSSKKSSILKPKSHKIYKIYKNSKSIGYLKHKKSSKNSRSSKKTL